MLAVVAAFLLVASILLFARLLGELVDLVTAWIRLRPDRWSDRQTAGSNSSEEGAPVYPAPAE